MVIDLMLGGDLRFHLERSGNMKEDIVRFYVAELACALDYLHNLQIVHRDIKPDNVLLDEKGHAHLTDFNIAVHFSPRRPLTSVAGSMAYMAPEVLTKRGYLSSVDWWSLGVLAYELLFGRRPFNGKTNSALTHSIMNDRCSFPDNVDELVSRETVSCIRGMLERDTRKRMGCKGGLADFVAHPWFAPIDFNALQRKQITPPFEPDSKKANFDATHELEELLLEDNPLKARKRDEKRDINTLSPELKQMEVHFLPFDHLKQVRRSYFKNPRKEGESSQSPSSPQPRRQHLHLLPGEDTSTQHTASGAYTLQDQPLAEMGSQVGTGIAGGSGLLHPHPAAGIGGGAGHAGANPTTYANGLPSPQGSASGHDSYRHAGGKADEDAVEMISPHHQEEHEYGQGRRNHIAGSNNHSHSHVGSQNGYPMQDMSSAAVQHPPR